MGSMFAGNEGTRDIRAIGLSGGGYSISPSSFCWICSCTFSLAVGWKYEAFANLAELLRVRPEPLLGNMPRKNSTSAKPWLLSASSRCKLFPLRRCHTVFINPHRFLLGQVVGSILLSPWSETFGRKRLYVVSAGLSAICCMIVGLSPHLAGVVVPRVTAGLLSAIPYTVASGSCEDLFGSRERIWVIFGWTVASNCGLIIGPIMGTHIIAALDWRWLFYIFAIIIAALVGLLCLMSESRPSYLLSHQVAAIRRDTGLDFLQPLNHDHAPNFRTFAKDALFRPAQLFCTEPVVFVVALMTAVAFGLLYIFTEALELIYEAMGFSETQSSLSFIAIAVGVVISTLTRWLDEYIFDLRHRRGLPIRPEDKLVGLAIGAAAFAIGLWWLAWTIPPIVHGVHWMVPTVSLAFIGYALNEFDTVLQGYLADSYLSYSASGTAAVQFLRALLSAVFPLFTPQMFNGLGLNIATSILAIVATLFCAVPPIFMFYGERIRARSKFARYSLEIQAELGKDAGEL